MRISDWSSDVCSSDLLTEAQVAVLMRRLQERHPIVTDFGPNESQERPMKAGQILLRSSERFTPATDEEISKYRDESYPEWIAGCESFFRDLHVALDARQEIETDRKSTRLNSRH